MRMKIISKVLEEIRITRGDDISYELSNSRIEKDRTAVAKVVNAIIQNLNPFDSTVGCLAESVPAKRDSASLS